MKTTTAPLPPSHYLNLLSQIRSQSARIGVIGLGYVGLPLLLSFANSGFPSYGSLLSFFFLFSPTTGFDVDQEKILKLRSGISYIDDIQVASPPSSLSHPHLQDEEVRDTKKKCTIHFSSDMTQLALLHAVILCVPTPLLPDKKTPNLNYIQSAISQLSLYLPSSTLIILESTTFPGTTREVVWEGLRKKNVFLCFSPERISPGGGEG